MRPKAHQTIGIQCSNCGEFNDIDANRCAQCGYLFDDLLHERSNTVSREAQIRRAHEVFLAESPSLLRRSALRSQRSRRLVTILGICAILLIAMAFVWRRFQALQWEQQLESRYQAALACYQRQDYLCARDILLELFELIEARDYPKAVDLLLAARWESAQRYITEGKLEHATAELVLLLPYAVERPEIRATLARTYNLRIQSAQSGGNFEEFVKLNLERILVLGLR